jgi:molybdopterin converting factor small subunit
MASDESPALRQGDFTLLYFAGATSFTRKQYDILSAPLSIGDLYSALEEKYPGIKEQVLASSALTVNLDYVDVMEEIAKGADALVIQAGDEVAIIPPVSSG